MRAFGSSEGPSVIAIHLGVTCRAPSHGEHNNTQAQDAAPPSYAATSGSHTKRNNHSNVSLSVPRSGLCVCSCSFVGTCALFEPLLKRAHSAPLYTFHEHPNLSRACTYIQQTFEAHLVPARTSSVPPARQFQVRQALPRSRTFCTSARTAPVVHHTRAYLAGYQPVKRT